MSDFSQACTLRDQLKTWLTTQAAPLWAQAGINASGAFAENLGDDFAAQSFSRRARVQPRQLYAFAQAAALGWNGPAEDIVERGLAAFEADFRRPDGLFRALVNDTGTSLDETARLYDQAFALFGLASAYRALDDKQLPNAALTLLGVIQIRFGRTVGGFRSAIEENGPQLSNPHMHMLEACLEWYELTNANPWLEQADAIARLALTKFIAQDSGALLENFDEAWSPLPSFEGRIVEPGHQFEWAWLFYRWGKIRNSTAGLRAAMRLLEIGEYSGCDPIRGVAVNALLDDLSPYDAEARLWPQTERIKAGALAAILGDERGWSIAKCGAEGLIGYLEAAPTGLWRDRMTLEGAYIDAPSPASSFYHIVCAIAELDRCVEARLADHRRKVLQPAT